MVLFTVNLKNRYAWILLAILIIGSVIAYGTNQPEVLGHTSGEVHVDIPGKGTRTLKRAIADGDIGGNPDGYVLLATSEEWVEESWTKMNVSGLYIDTDANYGDQRINPIMAQGKWPSDAKEIVLEVSNPSDDYCVGGGGIGDRTGHIGTVAKCTDYRYRGRSFTGIQQIQNDWIHVYLNGNKMTNCPSSTGRVPLSGYPGTYGHPAFGVRCVYGNAAWGGGALNEVIVETADWSGSFGHWDWKIWYR